MSSVTQVPSRASILEYRAGDPLDKDVTTLSRRVTCVNYTSKPVTTIYRSNLRVTVPPVMNRLIDAFVIRTEYLIPHYSFENLIKHFALSGDVDPKSEDGLLREAFYRQYDGFQHNNMRIVLEHSIPAESLDTHNAVYVSEKDMVLTTSRTPESIDHPFSNEALLVDTYKALTTQRSGLGLSIEIIDNHNTIAPRFVYFGDAIFRIIPGKDPLREEGVYLGHTTVTEQGEHQTSFKRYTFEDAEKALGLYRSREEALAGGDVRALRQEEIATVTHANTMLNLELARVQQEHKTEVERIKAEYAQMEYKSKRDLLELQTKLTESERSNSLLKSQYEQEKITLDMENQRLKAELASIQAHRDDYFKQKDYDRKDSHELFKFTATAITAGLGIWLAISKAKPQA